MKAKIIAYWGAYKIRVIAAIAIVAVAVAVAVYFAQNAKPAPEPEPVPEAPAIVEEKPAPSPEPEPEPPEPAVEIEYIPLPTVEIEPWAQKLLLPPGGGLPLNESLLSNVGRPMAEILREDPELVPQELGIVDAVAQCFGKAGMDYSYLLFITQYLPYDEDAAAVVAQGIIPCIGIYTTVGALFPDAPFGESPNTFFDKPGVEQYSLSELSNFGISYGADFIYGELSFTVWGGKPGATPALNAADFVTLSIPYNNDEPINRYHNDITWPDAIGCAQAIAQARAYRLAQGKTDCDFWISRDAIIDCLPTMNLPDDKAYILNPRLDYEDFQTEKGPVYYVGYKSGVVYEWHGIAD